MASRVRATERTDGRFSSRNYAAHLLDEALEQWPEREALVHGEQRWSYADLDRVTRALSGALGALVQPGEYVAVLSGNRPELVAVQLAVHLLGCRLVAVSPAITPRAMVRSLVGIAPAALLFDAPSCSSRARELYEASRPRHLLSLGPAPIGDDLLAGLGAAKALSPEEVAPGEQVKTVFLTGGTTGVPRPAQHGHGLYRFLRSLIGTHGLAVPGERRLVCTPLTYIGSHFVLPTLMSGGTLVLHQGFQPTAVVRAIDAEQINALLLPTVMLGQLLDTPGLAGTPLASLKRIQYGASRCGLRRLRQAMDRFGPVLQQVYGLTEAGPVSLLQPEEHDPDHPELLASAGRPVPGASVDIRDSDGRSVAEGGTGEVWVRGPGVMEGYLCTKPDSQPLTGGWLRTGDLGRVDAEGRLFVIDRIKDTILEARTGLRVWSGEVEEALLSHPSVRAAAVVGVPCGDAGEWVHAAVSLAAGVQVPPDALRSHVRALLNHEPAVPARVHFIDPLPLTAMGKVDKRALRRLITSSASGLVEPEQG